MHKTLSTLIAFFIFIQYGPPGLTGETKETADNSSIPSSSKEPSETPSLSFSIKNNQLTLTRDAKIIWETALPQTDKLTIARSEIATIAGDTEAALVILSGEAAQYKAVIEVRKRTRATLLWQSDLAYEGDIGDQTRENVVIRQFEKGPVLVKGLEYGGIFRCQNDMPLLYKTVYHPPKRKFVPPDDYTQTRPGQSAITATAATLAQLQPSVLQWLIPRGASSCEQCDNNPLMLGPPSQLSDGDPQTTWYAGRGVGEFVTMSTLSSSFGLTGLILELPADARARPVQLQISTDDQLFTVNIPSDIDQLHIPLEDPAGAPIHTDCLDIQINQVNTSRKSPITIGDVRAVADFDATAPQSFSQGLNDPKKREKVVVILRSMGPAGIGMLSRIWKSLNDGGRKAAVPILADAPTRLTATVLAQTAMTGDNYLNEVATRALVTCKDTCTPAIGSYLRSMNEDERRRAANLLATINTDGAFQLLLASLSSRDPIILSVLEQMLSSKPKNTPSRIKVLKARMNKADKLVQNQLLYALLNIASRQPPLAATSRQISTRHFTQATAFDDAYKSLLIYGKSQFTLNAAINADDPVLVPALTHEIPYLRATAIKLMTGLSINEILTDQMIALTTDPEPIVRLQAIQAVAKKSLTLAPEQLTALEADPWPHVRALLTNLARELSPHSWQSIVTRGLNDNSKMVVATALESAVAIDTPKVSEAITSVLTNEDTHPQLLAAAIKTAAIRCQADDDTVDALLSVLQKGAEPMANVTQRTLAVAAANALGQMRTTRAVKALKKAQKRSNPTTDNAITAALENKTPACKRK